MSDATLSQRYRPPPPTSPPYFNTADLLMKADYMWENGRLRSLITLLDEGEGQGYAAWRVLPAPENWHTVLGNGLHDRVLNF